jgi:hypothetical protein
VDAGRAVLFFTSQHRGHRLHGGSERRERLRRDKRIAPLALRYA